jgi:hypothetical protein
MSRSKEKRNPAQSLPKRVKTPLHICLRKSQDWIVLLLWKERTASAWVSSHQKRKSRFLEATFVSEAKKEVHLDLPRLTNCSHCSRSPSVKPEALCAKATNWIHCSLVCLDICMSPWLEDTLVYAHNLESQLNKRQTGSVQFKIGQEFGDEEIAGKLDLNW